MSVLPDGWPQPGDGKPNQARIYDYLNGGKDNYAADREAGDQLERMFPGMRGLVRQHRQFARAAAGWLAERGIRQFIDVGAGMPVPPVLGDVVPGARVAYVDADDVVLAHLRALPGWAAVAAGDASRPDEVMAAPELLDAIDLGEPAAVLLAGPLSVMDAGTAREAVAGYAARLAPGSAIAACCVSYSDQEAGDKAAAAYEALTGCAWHSHSREAIGSFFAAGGLELAQGGITDARAWWKPVSADGRDVAVLGGVGGKR